jgi:uncharacterized membrane protein
MRDYLTTLVKPSKFTSWTGFIAALSAIVIAGIILAEKLQLAANANYVTSCSFNAIVSCSPVMNSKQAAAFWGIPNPILGLAGFSAVACLYFISLFVKLPRFVWLINAVGTVGAIVFCFWLATQALFVIQAICIYCCGIWLLTSVLTWFSFKSLLQDTKFSEAQFYVKIGLAATIIAFATMVFFAFQDYWMSLLS